MPDSSSLSYVVVVAAITVIVIALSALWRQYAATCCKSAAPTAPEDVGVGARGGGGEARRRRQRTEGEIEPNEERPREPEGEQNTDDVMSSRDQKKKMEKEMKKEEKKNIREFQQKERERKHEVLSAKGEALKKRQEEKENLLNAQEDAARKALDERRAKEEEEYRKWKMMFAVEGEGETSAVRDAREDALLLSRFINYVKLRKTAELEEIAAEFEMKTPEVINRLQELEKMGRLTGIFDERGKFIYITPDEWNEVAQYLKAKGRVAISTDLVAACNRIIRLTPTDEDREKLQEENRLALELLTEELDNSEEKQQEEAI
eukprot:GHVS01009428.1.p1 GENE.GHVS01009428.1~~GHVS01009428.1.p1  ORF type:complete len:319 (+),score=88.34 GHVS01009428.1:51-1007(+)